MAVNPVPNRDPESDDGTAQGQGSSDDPSCEEEDMLDCEASSPEDEDDDDEDDDDEDDDDEEEDDEDEDDEDEDGDDGGKGEDVFRVDWDGGGMAANGFFYIRRRNSRYYFHDVDFGETRGPYSSLDEALSDNEVFSSKVNNTTTSIDCSELTEEEIVSQIALYYLDEDQVIDINNKSYIYKEKKGLLPMGSG